MTDIDWEHADLSNLPGWGGQADRSELPGTAPGCPKPPPGVMLGTPSGLAGIDGPSSPESVGIGVVMTDTRPPEDRWACMPCLNGPCKHFMELAQVTGFIGGVEHRYLFRYCLLLKDESGTQHLRDDVIRYCSRYDPPLLSFQGWRQRARSALLQITSGKRHNWRPSLMTMALARAARLLQYRFPPGVEALAEKADKEVGDD